MAMYLKATAFTRMFKLISSADHLALKTGVSPTVNISKAGAAFGAAAGTVTEVANGWYKVALTTVDTNTAGDLAFYITGSGADDTDFCDQVVDPAVAGLGVNVVNWNGTVVATPATAGIPDVNTKNINNVAAATPGAAGGVLIAGSNAGTTTFGALTVTGATTHTGNVVLSDGLTISAPSTGNRAGISVTGNGTGAGLSITGGNGATGNAIDAIAASTNGIGVNVTGIGTGAGIKLTPGVTGNGLQALGGATSGSAIKASGTAGNAIALELAGQGSAAGLSATGGATGVGIAAVGGGTSGDAIKATTTSGHGLNLAPVGTSKHGIFATGGNGGTSDGISAVAGTGGVPIRGDITGNITGSITTATNVTTVNGLAANVITAASIADGAIDRATFAADTGLQSIRSNTAQAGAATTITLDGSASAIDNFYRNALILLTGGTGVGQARFITGYVGATKVATVATWITNPDNTTTFAVIGQDAVVDFTATMKASIGTAVAASAVASVTGNVGGNVAGSVGSVTGNVGGNVVGSVASVTGNVGGNVVGSVASVTGNVGGNVAGSVGSLTTNNDKTGYSLAVGGIGAGANAAAELNAIADAFLDRNMATGSDNGTNSTVVRTVRQALRRLRNKESIAAGTGTVTKEDDATLSWTYAATTTAGDPVSSVDPT